MNAESWEEEIGLRTGEADRPAFEHAAQECYEHAGIPWHGNVVWAASPLAVALAGPVAAQLIALRHCGHGEQHDGEMLALARGLAQESVGAALWRAAREAAGYARRARVSVVPAAMEKVADQAVEGVLAPKLRSSAGLMGAVMSSGTALRVMRLAVHSGVRAALARLATEGSLLQQALRGVISRAWYQYISGQRRVAFGLLFDDLCGEGELREQERAYQDAIAGACCWYPHREFLLACDWPLEIHLERIESEEPGTPPVHQLHRSDGAALCWADGWGVHALHGHYQAERPPTLALPRAG